MSEQVFTITSMVRSSRPKRSWKRLFRREKSIYINIVKRPGHWWQRKKNRVRTITWGSPFVPNDEVEVEWPTTITGSTLTTKFVWRDGKWIEDDSAFECIYWDCFDE